MRLGASRSPALVEVLRAALDAAIAEVHTCLPARVESYDSSNQTVNVKPLLKRNVLDEDGGEVIETLPVIQSVPVVFPRAGGFFITFPIQVGDFVTLFFAERSLDRWIVGNGDEVEPVDVRTHDLSDAVAVPGLYPLSSALASADEDDLVLGKENGYEIHVKDDQADLGSKDAADFVALAGLVKSEITALRNTVNGLVSTFNAHTHPYVDTPIGPSITSPTTTPGTPPAAVGDVKADKTKAD